MSNIIDFLRTLELKLDKTISDAENALCSALAARAEVLLEIKQRIPAEEWERGCEDGTYILLPADVRMAERRRTTGKIDDYEDRKDLVIGLAYCFALDLEGDHFPPGFKLVDRHADDGGVDTQH